MDSPILHPRRDSAVGNRDPTRSGPSNVSTRSAPQLFLINGVPASNTHRDRAASSSDSRGSCTPTWRGRCCAKRRGLEFYHDDTFGVAAATVRFRIFGVCASRATPTRLSASTKEVMKSHRKDGGRVSETSPFYGVSGASGLGLPSRFCEMPPVESFANERLDDRLPADVQPSSCLVELVEHLSGEVHVHPLNRRHHPAGVGEEPRNVFTTVGSTCDLISAHCTSFHGRRPTSSLHRASALPALLSIASPDEGIRHPHPLALRR